MKSKLVELASAIVSKPQTWRSKFSYTCWSSEHAFVVGKCKSSLRPEMVWRVLAVETEILSPSMVISMVLVLGMTQVYTLRSETGQAVQLLRRYVSQSVRRMLILEAVPLFLE